MKNNKFDKPLKRVKELEGYFETIMLEQYEILKRLKRLEKKRRRTKWKKDKYIPNVHRA